MANTKELPPEELPEELPAEEVEAKPRPKAKPKAKAGAEADEPEGAESKPVKGKAKAPPSKLDQERPARAGPPPRRDADPDAQRIPYPPSPDDVPEDLTDYAESYVKQQNKLLAGLFV